MHAWRPLRKSIVILTALLFIAQVLILFAIFLGYHIRLRELWVLAGILAAYHLVMALSLLNRESDFRIDGTDRPLSRVNPSNVLTIARLSSIPTAVFLILLSRRVQLLPVSLPYLFVVFLTDFLDGIVARKRKEITLVGRYLDSGSDYLIIIATSIIFYVFALIPLWFFILILARLVLFALFMGIAALKQGKANPLSTFFGKASIFATMFLYLLEVAEYFGIPLIGNPMVVLIFEYVAAAVIAASFIDKAVFLRKLFLGMI
jgi:CDP-diacylglycerol--glycerol-3-phosphate 3-phosphatidyltransferase